MGKPAVSHVGDYPVGVIIAAGGEGLVDTFRKKIAGADANKDGRDFEISYGVCRTVTEVATMMKILRDGQELVDLDKYSFWDRPLSLVDDYYLNGVHEHFYAQLKRGSFDWKEVNDDINLQRHMDQALGFDVRYRCVIGDTSRESSLKSSIEADRIDDVDTEVFHTSTEFFELLDWNEGLFATFATITGSNRLVDQETAYESFHYQYWKTHYEETFVGYMAHCSRRKKHYIPRLERPPVLDALEVALEEACANCTGRIVGDMLRIQGAGGLRTYLIPSDSAINSLIKMLDEDDFEFLELVTKLEEDGWQRAAL
ncbi:hypothetical protein [Rhizobium leguminosarum]|uniref:hypothetical protein n=1 Tax=Rhizobium leguminosarum TaxID=384 RepID=UPI0004236DA5|nr:hypothetical protein [Rhizobium leguminosarum]